MSIKRADRYEHNNPNEPIVLSKDVKGGGLSTADLDTLLTDFIGKQNKLIQGVTKVFVISENADYRLVNIAALGSLASWKLVYEGEDLVAELAKRVPKVIIDGDSALVRNPDGGSYAFGYDYITGTKVTGIIRIRLPQAYSNSMLTIEGTIKRSNADEVIKFTVGGYWSGNTTNNWWSNEPASWKRVLTDNLDLPVKFGYVTISGQNYPIIDLGQTSTVWSSYMLVVIDKIYINNGFGEGIETGFEVSVVAVDDSVSNHITTFILDGGAGGGGVSAFADLEGFARDNADLNTELNTLGTSVTNEATARASGDAQIIDSAPVGYNTLNKIAVKLSAIEAIIADGGSDADSIVNTVSELLAVFNTYPEGTDIATLLAGKINATDIVNNLSQVVAGKVLDASQGKVLKDLIDGLTTAVGLNTAKRSYPNGDETKLSEIATGATANTKATSSEQQTGTDDVKFLTALSNAGWWTWIKGQVVNITAKWQFAGLGVGTAGVANVFLAIAASTASVGSFLTTFGASYTGSVEGTWSADSTGKRIRLYRNGLNDDILFQNANFNLIGTGTRGVTANSTGDLSTIQIQLINTGRATLVAGVATITATGLTTSGNATGVVRTTGGTGASRYKFACTTNTLTITAVDSSGTTVTTDTSEIYYQIELL